MLSLRKGRYQARMAKTGADLRAAQALRYRAFVHPDQSTNPCGSLEQDRFDAMCNHVLIEEAESGRLVCCFRLLSMASGRDIDQSYSAQFYGLASLRNFKGPLVELGRFCVDPNVKDPDVLRMAWGALTRFVDATGVKLLFGCSSFRGVDARIYHDAFAMLNREHLAPRRWLPKVIAPDVIRFSQQAIPKPDTKRARLRMPPLLRSYLAMGGWVSDHAVVDRDMNTLHVFTGLEIGAVPTRRARVLRAVAQ